MLNITITIVAPNHIIVRLMVGNPRRSQSLHVLISLRRRPHKPHARPNIAAGRRAKSTHSLLILCPGVNHVKDPRIGKVKSCRIRLAFGRVWPERGFDRAHHEEDVVEAESLAQGGGFRIVRVIYIRCGPGEGVGGFWNETGVNTEHCIVDRRRYCNGG